MTDCLEDLDGDTQVFSSSGLQLELDRLELPEQ